MFMHLTNSVILFCATFSFFTAFASYLGSFYIQTHDNLGLVKIGLFRYIKIQLDSESVRTKTKESG